MMPKNEIVMKQLCYQPSLEQTFETTDAFDPLVMDVWEELAELVIDAQDREYFINKCKNNHVQQVWYSAKKLLSILQRTALTSEMKKDFATQLKDGADECYIGFIIRINRMLISLIRPTTIDAFLTQIRIHLVEEIARPFLKDNEQSVHGMNIFFIIAEELGLGVKALREDDEYATKAYEKNKDEIELSITEHFFKYYTPLNILNELLSLLDDEFKMYYGYDITAENGLKQGSYEPILNFFKKMFDDDSIMFHDLFDIDESTGAIQSIKWGFVLKRLVRTFNEKDYMNVPSNVLILFDEIYEQNAAPLRQDQIELLQELEIVYYPQLLTHLSHVNFMSVVQNTMQRNPLFFDKGNHHTIFNLILKRVSKDDLMSLFPQKEPFDILQWTIKNHFSEIKNVCNRLNYVIQPQALLQTAMALQPNVVPDLFYNLLKEEGADLLALYQAVWGDNDQTIQEHKVHVYLKVLNVFMQEYVKKSWHNAEEKSDFLERTLKTLLNLDQNRSDVQKLIAIVLSQMTPAQQIKQRFANPILVGVLYEDKNRFNCFLQELLAYPKAEIEQQLLVEDRNRHNMVWFLVKKGMMRDPHLSETLGQLLKKAGPEVQDKILTERDRSGFSLLESDKLAASQWEDNTGRLNFIKQLSEPIQRSYFQKNVYDLWENHSSCNIFDGVSLTTQEAALQSLGQMYLRILAMSVCLVCVMPLALFCLPYEVIGGLNNTYDVIREDLVRKINIKINELHSVEATEAQQCTTPSNHSLDSSSSTLRAEASQVMYQLKVYLNTLTDKRLGRAKQVMILDALYQLKSLSHSQEDHALSFEEKINAALNDSGSQLNHALSFNRLPRFFKKLDQAVVTQNKRRLLKNHCSTFGGLFSEHKTLQTSQDRSNQQHKIKNALTVLREDTTTQEDSTSVKKI